MQSELEFKNSGKITTALFKISNAVNTTDNLDDLYKSIHKTLNKIMDLSNFYIALYDKKKDCLAFPYFIDEKDDEDTVPLIQNVSDPETPSSTAWIIQSGKPLLFNKDYLIAHMKKIKKDVVGTPPCVWMGSPLKVKKEVIGVIVAQSYSDPALYNKKDLEIFNSVSDQVALAIERKRAQDAETESKTINKVLFSISNAVNTTENLDELYKSIHKTLGSIIDVTNFMIGVYDHKKDTITYPYYKDEIDNDFSEIKNVSKSGIIASEVINLAAPFIINKNEALKRAKKIGADIVGMVAEQWLGIPLRLKQKVIGVIVVQSYSNPELYSEKDIEILMAVSDQIAMAIDRKYAQEELKNSEKLTRTLFKISNAVNTTLNLDDLFKSIHKILAEVIDVTNFAIGIYNSKKDIMSYPYYVDATGDSYNEIQNVSSSGIIASEVINLAKPFFITGVEILERAKKIGARITEAIPPEQWLGVPLKTKNKAIGVIVVQSYSDPELYNQKDADILTSISDQVATAITRKQSEDAKKESEEIKKVLFAISNAVNTTRNLDELYKSIHTFLSKIIDLTNFIIGLYNKKNNTLSFEYFIDQFDDLHGTSVILDDGSSIGGGIIKSGSPIFLTEKDLKEKAKHNIGTLPKTWIGVPLKVDNEVIGYMAAQSYTDPDLFDHKDLEILSAVSDQVAIAIDRKRSEEALKIAKNAAEASAKSKSEFLANMSHEIRTPMNAIMGLTELALKTDLDLRQKDYLNKIKSSSTSLLGIINDILDFSKIDAGKMDIENIDFRLNDVMDSLSDMFSTKTAEKEIEFIISISNDIPLNLIGDPLRLRQALINLTGNAVKFTKKGEIIVSVSTVGCKGDYIELEFAVKDTGIGIPKDRLDKLFASFVQADGSTTRKYGGTGLGLSISKQLIELMGGNIEVKSKVGKGTRFSFNLTFKQKNKTTLNHKHFDTELKGMKVLIVDDNRAARDIMHETLSSFHFNAKAVASGEKCIQELIKSKKHGSPYKLVILDLIMPGIDGIDTAKLIKNNSDITDVSIIMMTAFGREEVMHQAKKTGINAFLMKPVKHSVLLDTIMDVFGKNPDNYFSEVEEAENAPNELAQLNGLNVLLVEDNKINQLVASRILEDAGAIVTIASTGLKAVQLLETNVFDVVLMDIQMPEMDGYSATNAIRNKLKLHDLPVIAMTAHAMAGDKEKCINAGMNDYISKPIDSDLLYSKLIKFGAQNKNDSIDPKKIKTEKRQAKKALPINLPDFMPGIDIKSGISRFRGDTEIYIKLLADFINNYKNSIEKISTMIEGNRIKDVLNYLHGIKGIAGNLSLSALYKLSAELEIDIEKNAKADRTMLNNYEGAFLEASNTLNKIYELLNNSSAKQKNNFDSEFDPEDISEKINRLYEKILENDIEALDIFNVVKNLIQKRIPDDEIMILDKAINNFDFDEAKIVLFRIAEVFNITLKEM